MDDHYIYVFVRQDISLAEQLVHAAHAAYHMGSEIPPLAGLPSLVMIGIPHVGSLAKVRTKLRDNGIAHYIWCDPDTEYGPTAIATRPLSAQEKSALTNYRLWKQQSPGTEKSACGVTADGGTNAAVAQEREHSVFNGEVGSSSLSSGSKLSTTEKK